MTLGCILLGKLKDGVNGGVRMEVTNLARYTKDICDYFNSLSEGFDKQAINNLILLVRATTEPKITKEFIDKVNTLFPESDIPLVEGKSATRVIRKICNYIGIRAYDTKFGKFTEFARLFANWSDAVWIPTLYEIRKANKNLILTNVTN